MTIKELATFTGKNKSTIGRWVAKCNSPLFNIKLQNATNEDPADFSIDEIEMILVSGSMSKDAVKILMENAKRETLPVPVIKESLLTERDIALISTLTASIVSKVMENMESRVSNIEGKFEERKALLPPPEMEPKQQLKKIVNSYCGRTGCGFQEAYSDLYREFNYIYHVNVQLSAKNRNIRSIDYIDNDLSMINELISIASKIFADDQL